MPELVWRGKARGAARARPLSLRVDEVHGAGPPSGRLIHGDAERVLPALAPELEGRVDLVYVDPPFDTGGSFDHLVAIPGRPERVAIPAYEDARGLDAWLAWFQAVATGVYRLLAPGGSLYVHLDAHAAHYAKVVLDEIFGVRAFQREIVWRIGWISGFKSQARGWIRNHDTILFYAKGGRPKTFNKTHLPYPPGYVRRDGSPPKGKGYPLDDVWNASDIDRLDSIQIMSFSGEKVGYPTQKNESLVERIVAASSSPGDLVLDCCVGSGTTAVVASKLGRRWVACDASPVAVHVARRRLATMREPPAFVVERGRASPADGQLRAAVSIEGATCTVELAGYRARAPRRSADDGVAWIEGWCVEWDRGAGPARFGSSAWRDRRDVLPLRLQHRYDEPGAHRVRVRAYDARGGQATSLLQVRVTER